MYCSIVSQCCIVVLYRDAQSNRLDRVASCSIVLYHIVVLNFSIVLYFSVVLYCSTCGISLIFWHLAPLYCDLFHCPFVGVAIHLLVMIYLIIWMHSFFQLISVF